MKSTSKKLSEKQIENSILNYLQWRNIFAWKNQSTGIYDAKKQIYRKSRNKHHINGVSDIIGIFKGKPLFIEVKAGYNKPTEDQYKFLQKAANSGAISIVAYSVDDVAKELDFFERNGK